MDRRSSLRGPEHRSRSRERTEHRRRDPDAALASDPIRAAPGEAIAHDGHLARARGFAIAIPGPGEPDLRDHLLAGQLASEAEDLTGRDMTLEPQPSGRSVSSAFAFARCRAA